MKHLWHAFICNLFHGPAHQDYWFEYSWTFWRCRRCWRHWRRPRR